MLIYILFATSFLSAIALVIGIILLKGVNLNQNVLNYFVSFAAGVMLAAAFLDLLPEAFEQTQGMENLFVYVLLGIVVFFFLERTVLWFHHHDEHLDVEPKAHLIVLGDGIHNFIDGVAVAAAFSVDFRVGLVTTIAIALHEIPMEAADFSILLHAGMKPVKALGYNFLSALTSVSGGVVGFFFLSSLSMYQSLLLSFTAGMFIYIACSDLIPDIHHNLERKRGFLQLSIFLLGIFVLWFLGTVLEGV